MGLVPSSVWGEANHTYLIQSIDQVRHRLLSLLGETSPPPPPPPVPHPPPALEQLVRIFGLSDFERTLLLLCAGVEISDGIASLCGQIHHNPGQNYATFSLALMLSPTPHWSALTPEAPLRRWRLLEVGGGPALTTSLVRLDERILHYLMGIQHLDDRLVGLVAVNPLGPSGPLPPSYERICDRVRALGWPQGGRHAPVLLLLGSDPSSKRAIATALCQRTGLDLLTLKSTTLAVDSAQARQIQRLCERETRLSPSALLLDCDAMATMGEGGEGSRTSAHPSLDTFIENVDAPLIITSQERRSTLGREIIPLDIQPPPPVEQRHLWAMHLGPLATDLNGQLDQLVGYFNLGPIAIQTASAHTKRLLAHHAAESNANDGKIAATSSRAVGVDPPRTSDPQDIAPILWEACLSQARPRMSDLAQPIDVTAQWDDLILPEKEKSVLATIAAHVRQRIKVYEEWGFGRKSRRGLGISALFSGVSGTGKTMAAEVIAQELNLDLYRIDISSVVSKYIGETEKNLRRIFDAAEAGGAILLFDEADSLFGKRSEVKDSHDRYANMEVSYLLQRIESYGGLAILTTNLKSALDQAFLRRIRFIVQFPFPDVEQRAEIWRRIFPPDTPTQDLAYTKLARLSVAGGNIRNIALNAAFLAADANEPVQMHHILQSAQSEYIKLERPLTDAEIKGWLPKESAG
ncbi:ATP-binding protein [Leptolyngbya sp. PCC 6406]|uniref:ATP-binding protein n=1 Tax=Leptolyngbya sp. PCC 6406 TaxID=1173264 RepID=UPI0002AC6686|nr:AAA family ATPase [Leptolyngbya sp. PCC 6406]